MTTSIGQSLSSLVSHRLKWKTFVGSFHYRNTLISEGHRLFVSTSGTRWNAKDNFDGVVCLDATSGDVLWRYQSNGDANEIIKKDSLIFGGTDAGTIFVIDSENGIEVHSLSADAPVYCRPIVVETEDSYLVVFVASNGGVFAFEPSLRKVQACGYLEGRFRVAPASCPADDGSFFIGTEAGDILKVRASSQEVEATTFAKIPADKSSYVDSHNLRLEGMGSLLVVGSRLIVSYVRETYDKHPPVVCFNATTGSLLWKAKEVKTVSRKSAGYGNARVTPAVIGDMWFGTFAYSDALHAFSLSTGIGKWKIRLDSGLFQNWASPILGPRPHELLVPRVNGIVHRVDTQRRRVTGAISVEIGSYRDSNLRNSAEFQGTDGSPIGAEDAGSGRHLPDSILLSGIAATPVVNSGLLIVGGVSGSLSAYSVE